MEVDENPLSKLSLDEIKGLLGTKIDPFKANPNSNVKNMSPVENFDSRTEWPDCIHPIRD